VSHFERLSALLDGDRGQSARSSCRGDSELGETKSEKYLAYGRFCFVVGTCRLSVASHRSQPVILSPTRYRLFLEAAAKHRDITKAVIRPAVFHGNNARSAFSFLSEWMISTEKRESFGFLVFFFPVWRVRPAIGPWTPPDCCVPVVSCTHQLPIIINTTATNKHHLISQ